jgi:hypothetical protein
LKEEDRDGQVSWKKLKGVVRRSVERGFGEEGK